MAKKPAKETKKEAQKEAPAAKERPKRRKRRKPWRTVKRFILATVVGLLVAAAIVVAMGVSHFLDRLPVTAAEALEKQLDYDVHVDAASVSWPGKITLENVTLRRRTGPERVASIGRVEAQCSLAELLAARIRVESLIIDGVDLRLNESDFKPREGPAPELPDHPIQVRRLNLVITKGQGPDARKWLDFSDVGLTLEPQGAGCLALAGSGNSRALGRFRVDGILGGNLLDSRLNIVCPRVPLGAKLRGVLPPQATTVWDRIEPSGEAALGVELSWPSDPRDAPQAVDLRWQVSAQNASARIRPLPAPITKVSALIEGTAEELRVRDLTGWYRSALLSFQGTSLRRDGVPGFRLAGRIRDLEPNDDVVGLFSGYVKTAIDELNLGQGPDGAQVTDRGKVDVDVELRFTVPNDQPPDDWMVPHFLRATVCLRDCSATPDWFPYHLTKVTGAFNVGLDDLVITSPIVGWHGNGTLNITGTVDFNNKRGGSEITVEGHALAVDSPLGKAVQTGNARAYDAWKSCGIKNGTGTIDATLKLNGSLGPEGECDWDLQLALGGCTMTHPDFPYVLTGLTGRVHANPDQLRLTNIHASHGDTPVTLSGWIDGRPGSEKLNLTIRATDVKLDRDLKQACDAESRKLWDQLEPAGTVDLDVLLSTPTRAGQGPDLRITAAMKDCSGKLPIGDKWLPVSGITGTVESFGDVHRFTDASGKCLGGQAQNVAGVFINTKDIMKLKCEFTGDNFSVGDFVSKLPKETEDLLKPLSPSGKFTVRKCSVDVLQRPGQGVDLQYSYTADLRDVRLSIPGSDPEPADAKPGNAAGFPLSEINGRLQVENLRERVAIGSFALDTLRLLDGTLHNVAGRFRKTGPIFALEGVRGQMYGGEVEASFKGATDLSFFTGQARATGINVAKLCHETGLTRARVWGDLRAGLQLTGWRRAGRRRRPGWRLSGSGTIDIDRANLGETPLVQSILDVKSLLIDRSSVIESASVDFEIDSRKLWVNKILLSGAALSTRGVGWVKYASATELDLYFYRKAKGSLLPDIPFLDIIGKSLNWVVDKIQNQLVVVHVTGTFKNPVASTAVLKDLQDHLKQYILINVKEEEEEGDGTRRRPRDRRGERN